MNLFSNASQKIYKENKLSAFTLSLAHPVDLSSGENWEVTICEISCSPTIVDIVKPALMVGDTNVLVYSNLITQQLVGNDTVHCLLTFIFPPFTASVYLKTFYVPVEQRRFQEIRIEFLKMKGKLVPFKDSKNPSKWTFTFVRITGVNPL